MVFPLVIDASISEESSAPRIKDVLLIREEPCGRRLPDLDGKSWQPPGDGWEGNQNPCHLGGSGRVITDSSPGSKSQARVERPVRSVAEEGRALRHAKGHIA